jgi:6-methylsalicylate decarboxylase
MPFTIDVHHHIPPDFFWRETNEHGPVGGVAPAAWSREVTLSFMDEAEIDVAGTAAETFRRLYWDTALSWHDPVLEMLRSVVGIDRVVYGSDFPYLRRDLAIAGRRQLARTEALSAAEHRKVFGETARGLLPRLVG